MHFLVILISLLFKLTAIRTNAILTLKDQVRRTIDNEYHSGINSQLQETEESFSPSSLNKYFPPEKFKRTKTDEINGKKKRNQITSSISDFSSINDGALVVINYDKDSVDDNSIKKSSTPPKIKKQLEKGINIIIDSNGKDESEAKKDEIYHKMETDSEVMEEEFDGTINNPGKYRRTRVVLITPIDNIGSERDSLPKEPETVSLDNLPEIKRESLVLSEAEGADQTEKSILDSVRKTELEIDIDKLKHVKEKLKLLNEDDDNDMIDSTEPTLLQPENRGKFSKFNQSTVLHEKGDSKTPLVINQEAPENKLHQKSKNETDVLSLHEVKLLLQEDRDTKPVTTDTLKNVTKLENKNDENNDEVVKGKQDGKRLFALNPLPKVRVLIQKPPGNPSPDDSDDLMMQKEPLVRNENPTKTSNIFLKQRRKKKEETIEHVEKIEMMNTTATPPIQNTTLPPPQNISTTHSTTMISSVTSNKQAATIESESNKQTNTFVNKGNEGSKKVQENPNTVKVPQARIIDKRKAEAIIEFMNKDPLETWKYRFNTLKSLDLNSSVLRSGLVNAGNIERLKGVMRRALEGKDITLSVVGGSISAGGGLYKDRGNIDGLYYKGVVDWWNKMISPLTGSDMIINNIAIGSIGTDYFSYCVKNHIANESDLVFWELSANDYNRYKTQPTKGARPLERLTRTILELPNKPALLYVNFFKGVDYKSAKISCPNFEDQGEDVVAHYYKIPSLSWRAMVCNGLVRNDPGYSIETLFSQDQYHPSLRGHAQMSLLLLLHLRHVMRSVLQWAIAHEGYIERFEDSVTLPEPLFMGPIYPVPLCWTLITADLSDRITNSLDVRVVKDNGYKLEYATNFPIRFDKVICWKAEISTAEISLQFLIPKNYDSSGKQKRTRSEVAITTHTRWGGSASIWIDGHVDKAVIIKEGRPMDPGKRTQVDTIANDVGPGFHTLNIRSIDGGFCLAAIMIDGS